MADNSCPVCANRGGNILLAHRDTVPCLQNVALADRENAIAFGTGTLTMIRCAQCSFVWNGAFDQDKISYDDGYNNDVTLSDYYVSHLEKMADRIIASVPSDAHIHYVEIGCGEADFLRLVVERANGRCVSAVGFDPSFTGQDNLPDCAVVHKTFFGPDQVKLIPDATNVICSRHTIEHVPNAHEFTRALTAPMTTPNRTLFIETPDADWILQNTAFQDFFYEHCSIYTPASMARILADYGLDAQTTPVYGGQYMWTEARIGAVPQGLALNEPDRQAACDLARSYVDESTRMLQDWQQFIQDHAKSGPVAIWGAASKGVTFTLLLSQMPDTTAEIACAIDLNVAKQECFMPVTGTPIVSPQAAQNAGVGTVIVMNPNYLDEIKIMAENMGWPLNFVTLNAGQA